MMGRRHLGMGRENQRYVINWVLRQVDTPREQVHPRTSDEKQQDGHSVRLAGESMPRESGDQETVFLRSSSL